MKPHRLACARPLTGITLTAALALVAACDDEDPVDAALREMHEAWMPNYMEGRA